MQIRRVTVQNFRGIREADWRLPDQRFLCLVGAGDSTKTTLLEAISLVMTARTNITFSDADFYNCDVSQPLVARVLLGDLTDALLHADTGFGMWLTGLTANGGLEHDPMPSSEPCVMLQLVVDADLEPSWTVVRHEAYDDGLPLTAGRRRALGMFRVDERVDSHLRWGRGSALARLTDGGTDEAVTSVRRASRDAVFNGVAPTLLATATTVAQAAAAIGGGDFVQLRPGWDPIASASPAALLLHEDMVPMTHAGLGTRRLVSMAAQELATQDGNLLLVDEVEHGLEPHRLLHVLHELRKRSNGRKGQVIVTTHSPVAVQAMAATDISVVGNANGITTVMPVPADLDNAQGALRAGPSALLARRVVVGEGKTETGMLRALIRHWDIERIAARSTTHAAVGATFLYGEGANASLRAKVYQELGVTAALLVDNDDRGVDKHIAAAEAAGVMVARWQLGNSTEAELLSTVSDEKTLSAILAIAVAHRGKDAIRAHLRTRLDRILPTVDPCLPETWNASGYSVRDVQAAIVAAANDNSWFKREDAGESLGDFVHSQWPQYATTHLGLELTKVKLFIYGRDPRDGAPA